MPKFVLHMDIMDLIGVIIVIGIALFLAIGFVWSVWVSPWLKNRRKK